MIDRDRMTFDADYIRSRYGDDPVIARFCDDALAVRAALDEANASRKRHGRSAERKPIAKLTEDQVREIRTRKAACDWQRGITTQLATEFGVKPDTIRKIVRREMWLGVEPLSPPPPPAREDQ